MKHSAARKGLIYFLVITHLWSCLPVWAQPNTPKKGHEKNEIQAAVVPIVATGKVSVEEQKVFSTRLRASLDPYYRLISQEAFLAAEEETFANVEEKKCTEEHCMRRIQELLQVERTFILEVTRLDPQTVQLGLTMLTLDDKKVKDLLCEKCTAHDLYQKIDELVQQMVQNDPEVATTATDEVTFVPVMPAATQATGGIIPVTPKVGGDRASRVAQLYIDTDPKDATVFLGNIEAGTTPYQNLSLKPGTTIQLRLKKENYHEQTLAVPLSNGKNDLGVRRLKPNFGDLTITTNPPGAEVKIAGKRAGQTPYNKEHITSGAYLVTITKQHYLPVQNQRIVIQDEKLTELHYDLEPGFGSVEIETTPGKAAITVFDAKGETVTTDISPATLKLDPGRYELLCEKKGYADLRLSAEVARNRTYTVKGRDGELRLLAGTLTVSSKPFVRGAVVYVDDARRAELPADAFTLPQGPHRIRIETPTQMGEKEVVVKDQSEAMVMIDLETKEPSFLSKYKWWIIGGLVLVGAGAAAAGGGGGGDDSGTGGGGGDDSGDSSTKTGQVSLSWD